MKTIKIKGRLYPSEIVILSRTFKVKWHEGKAPCVPDDQLVQGWFDIDNQTLHVDRTMRDEAVAEVLWHEAKHAVYWMWENEGVKREEEDIVNQSAITDLTIARQNPGLLTWLDEMANA